MTPVATAVRSIIITVANTFPKEDILTLAAHIQTQAASWVTVFQSSSANRTAVKNSSNASTDPGTKQLGAVLTALTNTSDANMAIFITAYKLRAANMVAGLKLLAASGAAGTVSRILAPTSPLAKATSILSSLNGPGGGSGSGGGGLEY